MGKPAARVTDMHICPKKTGKIPHVGGPIATGSPDVLIGGLPAARVGDTVACVGPPDKIASGSSGVLINGLPAARMGDSTAHGGKIIGGCSTVLIGDGGGKALSQGAIDVMNTHKAQMQARVEAANLKAAQRVTAATETSLQKRLKTILGEVGDWSDRSLETFDRIGRDPDTPNAMRTVVAFLKTPARLGAGLVSGAADVVNLAVDNEAREALKQSVVAIYNDPGMLADMAKTFADQPGHEIASKLFAMIGGGVAAAGMTGKVVKGGDGCPGGCG